MGTEVIGKLVNVSPEDLSFDSQLPHERADTGAHSLSKTQTKTMQKETSDLHITSTSTNMCTHTQHMSHTRTKSSRQTSSPICPFESITRKHL